MRAVVQRVSCASVEVDGRVAGKTDGGLLVFLGVGRDDVDLDGASRHGTARRSTAAAMLAEKVANLRIFPDSNGKSNLSLLDSGGTALVVSQFTLYADCSRGRRPSFGDAADPVPAEALVEAFSLALERLGVPTATGRFGAHMTVSLVNDGPYTIILDTETLSGSRGGRSVLEMTEVRLPDYHTHTARCGHATGRSTEYVETAQAKGLSGIGIADHIPLLPQPDPGLSMGLCDLVDYVAEVEELKARFPGYVLLGVEADYRPQTISQVGSLLRTHPFDYTIGSVHHLGTWGFDDPRQMERYADHEIDDVWAEYFDLVGDAAESGLFTILGHLDLVKKFGYRPTRILAVELDRLVARIARAGVLVEINTAGLHRPVGEAYPTVDILRRLREAGVGITFGSDAHKPEEVGRDFAHATDLARAAGYTEYASLANHPGGGRAGILSNPLPEPFPGEDRGRGESARGSRA